MPPAHLQLEASLPSKHHSYAISEKKMRYASTAAWSALSASAFVAPVDASARAAETSDPYRVPPLRHPRAYPRFHALHAGALQCIGRRMESGACGHDIVDQDDVRRQVDIGFCREGALEIAPSRG